MVKKFWILYKNVFKIMYNAQFIKFVVEIDFENIYILLCDQNMFSRGVTELLHKSVDTCLHR